MLCYEAAALAAIARVVGNGSMAAHFAAEAQRWRAVLVDA